MIRTIRWRLLISHTVLVLISIAIFGFYMMEFAERMYTQRLESQTRDEARVVAVVAAHELMDNKTQLGTVAKQISDTAPLHISFLSPTGEVLAGPQSDHTTEDLNAARKFGEVAAVRNESGNNHLKLLVIVPVISTNPPVAPPYSALSSGQYLRGYVQVSLPLTDEQTVMERLWAAVGWSLLVIGIASGLVSWQLARSIADPLVQITSVAKQLAGGDIGKRVKVRRTDELATLGDAVNTMADRLNEQLEDVTQEKSKLEGILANMNSGVIVVDSAGRITLINRATEQLFAFRNNEMIGRWHWEAGHSRNLSVAIDQAILHGKSLKREIQLHVPVERTVELNVAPIYHGNGTVAGAVVIVHDVSEWRRLERMRSEFVANVSHELQTPVTAVKGFAETLLDGAMTDPVTCESFVRIIYEESDRLGRLVADLLQLSRIESRRLPLRYEEVNLADVVNRTVAKLRLQADQADVKLTDEVGDAELPVTVDPDKIEQVLVNLIGNAIAYTPKGGAIHIRAETTPSTVTLHVIDNGIGIEEQHISRLFERFYRVDQDRSRRSGGTGLGLSIAKHIVEAHAGSIHVSSVPGVGSDFYFLLPRRQSML